jgi:predicted nucleotide-binding protein
MLRLPTLIFSDPLIVDRGVFNRALGRFIVDLPPDYSLDWLESEEFRFALSDWNEEMAQRRDVFLAYSSAARGIANSLKRYIEADVKATVLDWQDDFPAGDTILSQIRRAADRCSVGIFLFTRDDPLEGDGSRAAPRDNVVFEAGYFAHSKGHHRILVVLESGAKMPADLGGQIYASLSDRSNIEPIERRIWSFLAEAL